MTNLASGQSESIVAELHEGNAEVVAALAYLAEAFEANPKAAFTKTAADWRQWLVDEGYTTDSVVEVIRQVLVSELDATQQEALFNNVAAELTLGEVAKLIHAQSPTLLNTLLRHVDHGAALHAAVLGLSGGSGKLLNAGKPTGLSRGMSTVARHLQNEMGPSAEPGVDRYDPNGVITRRDQIENVIGKPSGLNDNRDDVNLIATNTPAERITQDALRADTTIETANREGKANENPAVRVVDDIADLRFSSPSPVETPREKIDNVIGRPPVVNISDTIIGGDQARPGFPLEFMKDVLKVNNDFSSLESKYPKSSPFLKLIQDKLDIKAREIMLEQFDNIKEDKEDVEIAVLKVNELLVSLANDNTDYRTQLEKIQFEFDIDIYKSIKSFLVAPALVKVAAEVPELLQSLEDLNDKLNAAEGFAPGPYTGAN